MARTYSSHIPHCSKNFYCINLEKNKPLQIPASFLYLFKEIQSECYGKKWSANSQFTDKQTDVKPIVLY